MKPTILLVGNFLSSKGGNPGIVEALAERLKSAGYSLITTSYLHFRPLRFLDMIFTTWMRRKEYQAAYVEVYSGAAFIWAEFVCGILHLIKKPCILTLHGGNLPNFARRWPGRVKRLLNSASVVISPSHYLMEEMRSYRNNINLIPNPIEIEFYPFHIRNQISLRLIWLRAFHDIYNPQMAPLVVKDLQKNFPEILLTMVGPDKGDDALQETQNQIEELGLQQNIKIITGVPKSQVPEVLNKNDIFINTTNVDNTPISIIEAMACGLLIVSTNVGGIPYLLEDEKDAFLVPPNDPEAMASAIRRIVANPALAERFSQNARDKVEQFDWSIILPKLESLFFEIIQNKESRYQ